MLAAGTLQKVPLFDSPAKLYLFRDIALELIGPTAFLHAWAFLNNSNARPAFVYSFKADTLNVADDT